MVKRKQYSEEQRQKFADYLRSKPQHVLRRIADAYNTSLMEESRFQKELTFYQILQNQSLGGFRIGNRSISYSQARVVYEMVVNGKYGGLMGDGKPFGGLPVFQQNNPSSVETRVSTPLKEVQTELGLLFDTAPTGYFAGQNYAVGKKGKKSFRFFS